MKRAWLASIVVLGCFGEPGPQGPAGPEGPKGDKGDTGVAGANAHVATNSGLLGTGLQHDPIRVDFGGTGVATQAARSDHAHPVALISSYSETTRIAWTAANWTDVHTVIALTDAFGEGIVRDNSTFTFPHAGTYMIVASFNSNGSSQHIAFRLRRINGSQETLVQRTHFLFHQVPQFPVLSGLFNVASGDVVSLQYVTKNGSPVNWDASNPIAGEDMRIAQVDIWRVR